MFNLVSIVFSFIVGYMISLFIFAFSTVGHLFKGRIKLIDIPRIVCGLASLALIIISSVKAITLIVSFAKNGGYLGAFTWDRVNNLVGNSEEVWQDEGLSSIYLILIVIAFVTAFVSFIMETRVVEWLIAFILSGITALMGYGVVLNIKLTSIAHEGTMIYPEELARLAKRNIKLPAGYEIYLKLETKIGDEWLQLIIIVGLLASIVMLIRFLINRSSMILYSLCNIAWLFMILPLIIFMVENPYAGIVIIIGLIVLGIILDIEPSACVGGSFGNNNPHPDKNKPIHNTKSDNSTERARLQKELDASRNALAQHRKGSSGYFAVDEKAMSKKIANLENKISKLK